MDGQAYVTVQASAASASSVAMARSGGGSLTGSYRIDWTFSGGITDSGWTIPGNARFPDMTFIPVQGDIDATNAAISNTLAGQNYYYVDYVLRTWYCGSTV